ncbi:unnamed protein product [Urochloa decumbens]|uniref:DUF4220 domain-containing protein n=1 Tax=Urochloa decumbens TaxID=240449 RepID=A0ABC9D8I5_9POAL
MAFSSAVQWWEEWQLRILVLGSLCVQCYLSFFASARKKHIRPIFRFSIWLAYLGGDALAIYALATLFNRRSKTRHGSVSGASSHDLEVLWAPVLLMHLGGQTTISAYNIEDNELWRRHIVTAVSQVAVTIYVFCKSWSSPSADGRFLAAAILLFILGFFKCFEKPLALKRNSFSSIVSSFYPTPRTKTSTNSEVELEEYIQGTRDYVIKTNGGRPSRILRKEYMQKLCMPDKLFVDFTYAYPDRLDKLRSFWLISDGQAYETIRKGISSTFNIIYRKIWHQHQQNRDPEVFGTLTFIFICLLTLLLPILPIGLFHSCHKEGYSRSDIKVTFSLLYITYLLEISSFFLMVNYDEEWTVMVAQHSLIGHLAYSRRRTWLMGITELIQCFKPCNSSKAITTLVRGHIRDGWMTHITDVESYWKFNDFRGHKTLERNGCEEILRRSIEKPFDENIVIWHVATDFSFYRKGAPSDLESATLCRQISNYMVHLLFANPEMLMPGSRGKLFTAAYSDLEFILQGEDVSMLDERQIAENITDKMQSIQATIVRDAWVLFGELMRLGDAKMWEVIRGVWVEMLCYSAGRCRGYLHAKSLGSGGEYLSFVSLLMSHAGLETFPERQQRVQLQLPKEVRMHMVRIRRMKGGIEEAARKKAAAIKKAALSNNQGNEAAAPSPEVEIVVS